MWNDTKKYQVGLKVLKKKHCWYIEPIIYTEKRVRRKIPEYSVLNIGRGCAICIHLKNT